MQLLLFSLRVSFSFVLSRLSCFFWSGLWWSGGTTGVTGGSTVDTWLCCPSWVAFGAWAVVPPISGGTSGHLTCDTTGPRSGSTAVRLRAYLYPTGRRVFFFPFVPSRLLLALATGHLCLVPECDPRFGPEGSPRILSVEVFRSSPMDGGNVLVLRSLF